MTQLADAAPSLVTPLPGRCRPLDLLLELERSARGRIRHIEHLAAREARLADWPDWVPNDVIAALSARGIARPWAHQVAAAEHAVAGRHVVLATGTASGKSLGYWLPGLSALQGAAPAGARLSPSRTPSVLYVAPTKALAHDQCRSLTELRLPWLRAATLDGDVATDERTWIRDHANWVLTNPDMLHRSLLPRHEQWSRLWRGLQVVVVDECHGYRGVFGSHVAAVLRRLRRVAAHHGASPVFVLASATTASPVSTACRLTGLPMVAVEDDGSPRAAGVFALWEPGPVRESAHELADPVPSDPVPSDLVPSDPVPPARRSADAEAADLLALLVARGARTVAFVRSRRGAEFVAESARRTVSRCDPALANRIATYRGGFLREERREVEAALHSGRLLGVATTNALELGVDVVGLDAVVLSGWPGTRAAMWQQAGRAGRAGQGTLAVLVGGTDPLDGYLLENPAAVFGQPVEATVLDPDNPYVLAPHLCAAAAEVPLSPADAEMTFGSKALHLLDGLTERGMLRRRPAGWFWTRSERACELTDLRGDGDSPVTILEEDTARVLGTVDGGAAHRAVHAGAVYVHQGVTHLVSALDLDDRVAFAARAQVDFSTTALSTTDVRVLGSARQEQWGPVTMHFGEVLVADQVVGFLRRRRPGGEVLSREALDLPVRRLHTAAVWWCLPEETLVAANLAPADVPGAAHAAEHAAIALLGLVATCDRWDVGGMSTAMHPDTGTATIFVHDGHPGGAGFAERGFTAANDWLSATRDALLRCSCRTGCPGCVQSPKCGNGNEPLDKAGAIRLLSVMLDHAPLGDAAPVDASPWPGNAHAQTTRVAQAIGVQRVPPDRGTVSAPA